MIIEHEFAQYIRTLGKGKRGQRSLSQQDAYNACQLILNGEVEDIQLGAFLMLMRMKEETAEEIAGIVQAIRDSLPIPENMPPITVDWSSYAGKRRHLPWFILSAILLSQNGYPVFMHGIARDDDRVYAEQALQSIGIAACESFTEVASAITITGFAYLAIENISPLLSRMIELRQMLGLRTPGHTISRSLNPLSAKLLMQGIFHPGYAEIHQHAAHLLDQEVVAVFKGEGGEIERDPDKFSIVYGVDKGKLFTEEWPPVFDNATRHIKEDSLDLKQFQRVWSGAESHEYGEAAVISTTAIAIKALGITDKQVKAILLATNWWQKRNTQQAA